MIKVKALEFEEYARGRYKVRSCKYWYWVEIGYGGFYTALWSQSEGQSNRNYFNPSDYPTLTDAKAACQAHHEQHVLSMIEVEG